jgi:hypothetical protein
MLKDLIKSQGKAGYVIPLLEEATLLAGKRDAYNRRRDCFHPSEISGDFCPRAWLLGQKDMTLYLENEVGVQTQWRFDVGSTLHTLIQERLGLTGKLFGMWKCKRWCLEDRCVHYGFKPEGSCPLDTPEKASWEYEEVDVVDEDFAIYGKTDGIVVLQEGKFVLEFKTMNSRTFSTLAEPLAEHKEQAAWYVDILERNSWKVEQVLMQLKSNGGQVDAALRVARQPFKGAIIVYMNKDTQEFREFMVRTSVPLVLPDKIKIRGMEFDEDVDVLEEKKKLIKQTLAWRDEGFLPERLDVCTSKNCARARKCFAKSACFKKDEV